ncbi:NUDIX hydrolase [Ornithinimicrobium cerasi]|uniref:NUDIX hydrolase n=1 Tax=Ornithinimicrobium cerasi TaxID=2248773 RepID=UPI00192A5823|nr:NUDIX domain-containing protein [Ornithinimicrobium cerasi]
MELIAKTAGQPYMIRRGPNYYEYQLPISVKAVINWQGRLPLLKNERNEWELPGGKLDLGESPDQCVAREVEEELGWKSIIGDPYFAWVYEIKPDRHVFILTYLATFEGTDAPTYSNEHKELVLVSPESVDTLNMPQPYKDSIHEAVHRGHFV